MRPTPQVQTGGSAVSRPLARLPWHQGWQTTKQLILALGTSILKLLLLLEDSEELHECMAWIQTKLHLHPVILLCLPSLCRPKQVALPTEAPTPQITAAIRGDRDYVVCHGLETVHACSPSPHSHLRGLVVRACSKLGSCRKRL